MTRPLPVPTPESRAFWTGGSTGRLMIHRCRGCSRWFHPPGPVCFRCRSLDVGPEPASGFGRVAAFTINRQQWLPDLPPPYVVAVIELAEDPEVRVTSNVVEVAPESLHVGLELEVFFEMWDRSPDDTIWLPLFRPREAGGGRARTGPPT